MDYGEIDVHAQFKNCHLLSDSLPKMSANASAEQAIHNGAMVSTVKVQGRIRHIAADS